MADFESRVDALFGDTPITGKRRIKPGGNDLTGKVFGSWTVLWYLGQKAGNHHSYWRCRCVCGHHADIATSGLVCGGTQSCGCQRKSAIAIQETGNVYGRLTVLGRSHSAANGAQWECRCECGKTVFVAGTNLRTGRQRSCGCLRAELNAARAAARRTPVAARVCAHCASVFRTEKRSRYCGDPDCVASRQEAAE